MKKIISPKLKQFQNYLSHIVQKDFNLTVKCPNFGQGVRTFWYNYHFHEATVHHVPIAFSFTMLAFELPVTFFSSKLHKGYERVNPSVKGSNLADTHGNVTFNKCIFLIIIMFCLFFFFRVDKNITFCLLNTVFIYNTFYLMIGVT